MMQVAKRIPFDDPNVLNAARGAYIISNLIIFTVYMVIRGRINAKKGVYLLQSCLLG